MVVTRSIQDRAKNPVLDKRVHFLPILSARGPATKGAVSHDVI